MKKVLRKSKKKSPKRSVKAKKSNLWKRHRNKLISTVIVVSAFSAIALKFHH